MSRYRLHHFDMQYALASCHARCILFDFICSQRKVTKKSFYLILVQAKKVSLTFIQPFGIIE